MSHAPAVSVIVPVRNRRALLRRLLAALAAQTFDDFEVVVVDDGSSDGAADEARGHEALGNRVRILSNPGAGAVAARRAGVAAASAAFLAFTDSDCEPAPGWLAAGVAALTAGADLAHGPTRPRRPPRPFERTVASGEEGLYPSCNVFYRRSAYDAAGGFDALAARRLRPGPGRTARATGFGEDTILAWQVRRSGKAQYVPEAEVRHEVFPADLIDTLRQAAGVVSFPALVRDVPELRHSRLLRGGIELRPRTRLPLYVAVAASAARSRRVARWAAACWVASRAAEVARGPGSVGARAAALPVELLNDVITATALAVGSVRARTPVI
jgi:hypothetical protein